MVSTERLRLRGFEFEVDVRAAAGEQAVVLLHGFPQSSASWDVIGDALAGHGVRSWALNQRGYSPGARPAGVEAYRLRQLVADVVALCDAVGLPAVHLVGHDWGAVVAWAVAAQHPERVTSVTALSVPHPAAFAAAIADDPVQREKSSYLEYLIAPGSEDVLAADGAAGLRLGFGTAVPEGVADRYIARLLQPEAMKSALNWYRAIGTDWAAVPPVTVPATLIWGTEDIAVARAGVELSREHVPGGLDLLVLDGRGHWLPEEVPAEVTAAILGRIAPPPGG
ncbi:alpha/beta fold hydrolase [Nocardia asteroides]|uniref:alpha/beta fold hydrolase n=1 Tax=Nocardia asteroides TaxID=1824 RepID=UPI001E5F85B5|nr:alpha/beta hydrolase [Nocardia asteroides]UGT63013.1 alpha/beta hydrolase [Nocardia asteroides]